MEKLKTAFLAGFAAGRETCKHTNNKLTQTVALWQFEKWYSNKSDADQKAAFVAGFSEGRRSCDYSNNEVTEAVSVLSFVEWKKQNE